MGRLLTSLGMAPEPSALDLLASDVRRWDRMEIEVRGYAGAEGALYCAQRSRALADQLNAARQSEQHERARASVRRVWDRIQGRAS